MDEVYACGYCEKEFSRVDELTVHADVCQQSGLLVDSEDEGSSIQSNVMDICKTFFKEEANEDEPSAEGNTSTEVETGNSHGCNRCGKTGFSNKHTRDAHERSCSGLFVRQPKFKAWKSGGAYYCKEPKCPEKTPFQSEYR